MQRFTRATVRFRRLILQARCAERTLGQIIVGRLASLAFTAMGEARAVARWAWWELPQAVAFGTDHRGSNQGMFTTSVAESALGRQHLRLADLLIVPMAILNYS